MPAPAFGAVGTALAPGSGTTAAIPVPSGVTAGQIVLVDIYKENSANITTIPSGFTLVGPPAAVTTPSGQTQWHYMFWKRATGADSGTYTFGWSGSTPRFGIAHRYTGCIATGTPFEASNSAGGPAGSTTPAVSLSTTGSNRLLVWTCTARGPANWSAPSLYTLRAATNSVVAVATREQAVAGSTGSVTGSSTITTWSYAAWLIALLPVPSNPPTISAGADVIDHPVGEPFTRSAVIDFGDSTTANYGWEVIDGPSVSGLPNSNEGFTFTPAEEATWTFRVWVSSDTGEDEDTFTLTSVEVPTTGDRLPANPGEALWIGPGAGKNHFNIGIGDTDALNLGDWSSDDHDDYSEDQIEDGFSESGKFFLNEDGNVVMRIGANDGRTSEGTQHPRTELREFGEDGDEIAFDPADGDEHEMWGTTWITHVAFERPWICFFQCHDASSDLIRIQTEGDPGQTTNLDIVARYERPGDSAETRVVLATLPAVGYNNNGKVKWRILFSEDGRCQIWLNDVRVFNLTGFNPPGCYFKAGCYLQTNTEKENGDDSQYGEVIMEKGSFGHRHTGWAANTEPVFTGELSDTQLHHLYLTNVEAAFKPGVRLSWWEAALPEALTETRKLGLSPEGPHTFIGAGEISASSPYDGLLMQWVSPPLSDDGVLTGNYRLCLARQMEQADADFYTSITIWVTQGDSSDLRGVAKTASSAAPWPVAPNADALDLSGSLETVNFLAGDRIAVELGFQSENTLTAERNGLFWFGGTGPDLVSGDTDVTKAPWLDIQLPTGVEFLDEAGPDPDPGEPTPAEIVHRAKGNGTAATSRTITMPAEVEAGDQVFVIYNVDAAFTMCRTTTPGWTTVPGRFGWESWNGISTNPRGTVFHLADAAGDSSDDLTINHTLDTAVAASGSVSRNATWLIYVVRNGGTEIQVVSEDGSGTSITIPSITGLDSNDYLSIVTAGIDNGTTSGSPINHTISQAPVGYGNPQTQFASTHNSVNSYGWDDQFTDVTEVTPSAVTFSPTDQWVSFHILVPPGEAPPSDPFPQMAFFLGGM